MSQENSKAAIAQNGLLGEVTFEGGTVYYAHHVPSGEDWVLLGVDPKNNKVCAAGYPPSIAELSDCCRFEKRGPITFEERQYRVKVFGSGWL